MDETEPVRSLLHCAVAYDHDFFELGVVRTEFHIHDSPSAHCDFLGDVADVTEAQTCVGRYADDILSVGVGDCSVVGAALGNARSDERVSVFVNHRSSDLDSLL